VSDHPVEIYTASGAGGGRAELDCGVFVRDASGNLLPRADTRTRVLGDGRTITVRDSAFNRKRKTLEPGEKFQDFTILNHLFNLSKPGAYTVVVKKDIPVEGTRPETKLYTATSNTIEITMLASEDTR
jgi:hypothetical protein